MSPAGPESRPANSPRLPAVKEHKLGLARAGLNRLGGNPGPFAAPPPSALLGFFVVSLVINLVIIAVCVYGLIDI